MSDVLHKTDGLNRFTTEQCGSQLMSQELYEAKEHLEAASEITALRAELDALKSQKPIGYWRHTFAGKLCINKSLQCNIDGNSPELPDSTPLYARPVPAIPDCETCQNRGKVNGKSQETYCENCKHWMTSRKDFYKAENYSPLAKEVMK